MKTTSIKVIQKERIKGKANMQHQRHPKIKKQVTSIRMLKSLIGSVFPHHLVSRARWQLIQLLTIAFVVLLKVLNTTLIDKALANMARLN